MVTNHTTTESPIGSVLSTNTNGNGDANRLPAVRKQKGTIALPENAHIDMATLMQQVSGQTAELIKDINASAAANGAETETMVKQIWRLIKEED